MRTSAHRQTIMGMVRGTDAADQIYAERATRFGRDRERCASRSRWLVHARLVGFIAAVAPFLWLLEQPAARFGLAWAVVALMLPAAFFALIVHHNRLERRCAWYDQLAKLNEEGQRRIARDWEAVQDHSDAGPEVVEPYAGDLDLFGRGSLSSLLATVGTSPGRSTLRGFLLRPAVPAEVRRRQTAIVELAPLLDVREEITVRGRIMPATTSSETEGFLVWAEGEPWLSRRPGLAWTARSLTFITFTLIGLNIAGILPYTAWLAMLGVNLAFTFSVGPKLQDTFKRAFARERAFQQYAELYRLISLTTFRDPLLRDMQSSLTAAGLAAHKQMERLHRVASLAEVRYSMLYLPIQAITLWDFHVLMSLERWQTTAGRHARDWTATLGGSL